MPRIQALAVALYLSALASAQAQAQCRVATVMSTANVDAASTFTSTVWDTSTSTQETTVGGGYSTTVTKTSTVTTWDIDHYSPSLVSCPAQTAATTAPWFTTTYSYAKTAPVTATSWGSKPASHSASAPGYGKRDLVSTPPVRVSTVMVYTCMPPGGPFSQPFVATPTHITNPGGAITVTLPHGDQKTSTFPGGTLIIPGQVGDTQTVVVPTTFSPTGSGYVGQLIYTTTVTDNVVSTVTETVGSFIEPPSTASVPREATVISTVTLTTTLGDGTEEYTTQYICTSSDATKPITVPGATIIICSGSSATSWTTVTTVVSGTTEIIGDAVYTTSGIETTQSLGTFVVTLSTPILASSTPVPVSTTSVAITTTPTPQPSPIISVSSTPLPQPSTIVSVSSTPIPVYSSSASVSSTSNPVYSSPASTSSAPSPAYSSPGPISSSPIPVYDSTTSTSSTPAPTSSTTSNASSPISSTSPLPTSTTSTPIPVYGSPTSVSSTPAPTSSPTSSPSPLLTVPANYGSGFTSVLDLTTTIPLYAGISTTITTRLGTVYVNAPTGPTQTTFYSTTFTDGASSGAFGYVGEAVYETSQDGAYAAGTSTDSLGKFILATVPANVPIANLGNGVPITSSTSLANGQQEWTTIYEYVVYGQTYDVPFGTLIISPAASGTLFTTSTGYVGETMVVCAEAHFTTTGSDGQESTVTNTIATFTPNQSGATTAATAVPACAPSTVTSVVTSTAAAPTTTVYSRALAYSTKTITTFDGDSTEVTTTSTTFMNPIYTTLSIESYNSQYTATVVAHSTGYPLYNPTATASGYYPIFDTYLNLDFPGNDPLGYCQCAGDGTTNSCYGLDHGCAPSFESCANLCIDLNNQGVQKVCKAAVYKPSTQQCWYKCEVPPNAPGLQCGKVQDYQTVAGVLTNITSEDWAYPLDSADQNDERLWQYKPPYASSSWVYGWAPIAE